ncbi:MAG: hypothetical protein KJ971_00305 [Firmicutes bacterium]|nr:hypothetical protein [Bacillota bacterium]
MKYSEFKNLIKQHSSFAIPKEKDISFIVENHYQEKEMSIPSKPYFKKLIYSLSLVSVMIFSLVIIGIYITPSISVTLDINPSVELQINRFGKVIGVESLNEDSIVLIDGLSYRNQNLEIVLQQLYDISILEGYSSTEQSYFLFGVQGSSYEKESEIEQIILSSFDSESVSLLVMNKHNESTDTIYSGFVSESIPYREFFVSSSENTILTTTAYSGEQDSSNLPSDTYDYTYIGSLLSQVAFSDLALSLHITEAKLQLILNIVQAYPEYNTFTKITEFSNFSIQELFALYQGIS